MKKQKPITIRDLFFELPAEGDRAGRIPSQRCRYVGPSGPTTVLLEVVRQDRERGDRDGYVEYAADMFEELPIVTIESTGQWARSVVTDAGQLRHVAKGVRK